MYTPQSVLVKKETKETIIRLTDSMRAQQVKRLADKGGIHFGYRFSDSEQVFQALCMDYLEHETAEEDAKELEVMSTFELQALVAKALESAAAADHYYEFEKEY